MTRRDFQNLASVIYESRMTTKTRQELAYKIAQICARSNKEFDAKKFYDACGVVPKMETKNGTV